MTKRLLSAAVMTLVFGLMFTSNAFAQETGRITGEITDQSTGETLAGATVQIVGTNRGVVTDQNGRFNLTNVTAGTVELQISYIGYERITETVTVMANEDTEVNFSLRWDSVEGEEISITAQAQGQIRAINEQRSSNTISNIVSSDRIRELPDVNAAESVGRLPGVSIQRSGGEANKIAIRGLSPKYNSVTINGVKMPSTSGDDRSVDLSLVSSNMLDGIEVKKANTPDMDADAFGGSVDLRLRQAPEDFQVDVSAQGGYTHLQQYLGNYKFSGTASNRFLDNKLGVMVSGNTDRFDRSADKFSGQYVYNNALESMRVTQTGLREENVTRSRLGGSVVLDYQIPRGKIVANSFYNQSENDALHRINTMNIDGNSHFFDMERREGTTKLYTGALSIEQDHTWFRYDATFSRTASRYNSPEDFTWRFGKEGDAFEDQSTTETHPTDVPELALNDSSSALSDIWVWETDREENVTSAELNIEIPFNLSDWGSGFVKTGGKFKWLDRMNDQQQTGRAGLQYGSGSGNLNAPLECISAGLPDWNLDEVVGNEGFLPLSMVLSDYSRDQFLDGRYDLGFTYSESKMMQLTRALQSCDENYRNNSIGSRGRDYSGEERYEAAYVMAEIELGSKVTFIPGVRWESDWSEYQGQRYREVISAWQDQEPAQLDTLVNVRENSFLLPMVHLQYSPTSWLDIRMARTETLSRPDYIQYAPITTMNTYANYVRAANGLLEPSHSTNYDLSFSLYENRIGFFSVSGFYKEIEDLIISLNYKVHPDVPQLEGMNVPEEWVELKPANGADTYMNNPFDATYRGIEFDWQTNFWYLPSVFQGLVLSANYTYIESEMTFQRYFLLDDRDSIKTFVPRTYYKRVESDSLRTGRMPDQPKHVANITLGYDYKGFSARLSYLYQGNLSAGINLITPALDTFTGSYSRWDLSIRQKLIEGLEVYGNFNNLTSTQDRSYRESATSNFRPSYIENYGFTMDMGIRYRF
jgi:TonB-dependent receptor